MIPKVIHYTWFSDDPLPALITKCMASWKKIMPDYEVRLWDYNSVKDIDNPFIQEALAVRKWAFAADYVRLYALYHHGGIYLDTDVEVYKDFSPLLNSKVFIGRENSLHPYRGKLVAYLTSHCFGAEAGHKYIKQCLDYYKGRHFIQSKEEWLPDDLKYNQTIIPYIMMEIAILSGYSVRGKNKGEMVFGEDVHVYPYSYFDCFYPKSTTYCRHIAMGSWRQNYVEKKEPGFKDKLKLIASDYKYRLNARYGILKP